MWRRSATAERRRRLRLGVGGSGAPGLGLAIAALAVLAVLAARSDATVTDAALTSGERAAIIGLGPWPPAAGRNGADAVAGPATVALGEVLFHSARLSPSGLRCASCHEPWRHFSDGRPVAQGMAIGSRNTPSLLDVGQHRHFGWDGARDQLWLQSLRPLEDAREMPATAAQVAALMRRDPVLAARYGAVFGTPPGGDDARIMQDVGLALASYVGTLTSARTPFDDWRDQLAAMSAAREPPSSEAFPAAARRGLRLFVGRGACIACHRGPAFSDDAVHESPSQSAAAMRQPGADIPDEPAPAFRTPGLRNVAATGPYLHDGSATRLCDALQGHAVEPNQEPPRLSTAERGDLLAFLKTLSATGEAAAVAPC